MTTKTVFSISSVALAISVALLCFPSNAMAADSDKIIELERRLDALEKELIEAKDAANKVDRIKFSKSSPTPELISKDGSSTLEFTGRFQADYVSADELYTGNKFTYEDKFNDASLRRIRFGIEGYFSNVWKYALEFDFDGESDVEIKDANVSYRGWDNNELTIGFQKFGFGLEATGSSKNLAFLERASTDTFSPERGIGIEWGYIANYYNFKIGYGMNAGFDDDDKNFQQDIFNARFTAAPINNNVHLLHLGASALYTLNNDEVLETRYRARPSSKPAGRIIDTGKFDADSTQHYGIEAAYQRNNLLLQAEYMIAKADQVDDPTITVDSYYAQAVYTLTGESWQYSNKKGTFKAISPASAISAGGYGAWELAVRYDHANFDDTDSDIIGGKKTDYILGVNWYLENNLKTQLNYVHTKADYKEAYVDIDGVTRYDQDGNIIQARVQFAF
ncbi:OprO/OprP family phosphate-selective porin [Shewanella frigidimarina]|uniref:Phosphate-selective porin O and P n=1 Tax=Shewanella frigidimarina (strain NCIMB 400) TaxID=318167 RepID=Q07WA7_SHEFN|nr:porin [Shewanella frigidimarina]ABI73707.1 phosphate-selective porin O and P [Shewanella frigidimarina NCIMB 400]